MTLKIEDIDPKEDIRMTGQDLINLLVEARKNALRKFYSENYLIIDNTPVCSAINQELKSLIKEG